MHSQVNACRTLTSVKNVDTHSANLACFSLSNLTMSEAHIQISPVEEVAVSSLIEQPVWSAPLESDSGRSPGTGAGVLTGQHSTIIDQLPPTTPTRVTDQALALAPAVRSIQPGEPIDQCQQQQSHCEEPTPPALTPLTELPRAGPAVEQLGQKTTEQVSNSPLPAQRLHLSQAAFACTPVPAPDPTGSCSTGLPPVPPTFTGATSAAAIPSDPTGSSGGTKDRVAPPSAEGSETAPGESLDSDLQPATGVETLTIACDPAVYSPSSDQRTTASDGDKAVLSSVKPAVVEDGVIPASPQSVGITDGAIREFHSGETQTIGSVLLSGDRLAFRCAQCPELFSSVGRLRAHHGLQHTPSPPVTAVRRRRRPPVAAADIGNSPGAGTVPHQHTSSRRTRSGRTHTSLAPVTLKCDICGKVLSSSNKLAVHQRMHSGERPHVCTYCPKRCNDLGNLRKHELLHFKARPFRCATCRITFWTALRHRAHRCQLAPSSATLLPAVIAEGGDDADMPGDGQEPAPSEERGAEYQASPESQTETALGGRCLAAEQALGGLPALAEAAELVSARPKRNISPEREPNVNSGLAPVVPVDCDVCGRRLRSISGWQRHRRLHAGVRPYQCRFCDKTCNDSGNMRKHEAGHFKERPYRCETCCITFLNAWRLGLHQCKLRADGATVGERTARTSATAVAEVEVEAALESRPPLPVPPPRGRHAPPSQMDARGRRRDHVCPVCNKALLSYASLEMHYRTHTGEKPYQCVECGKRFSIQGNLVVHTRIHTGERPFQCDECGKMFMYQSHLKVHKRGHSGSRPYRCQFCQKGFAASSSKRVHEETVHSMERKFICEVCGAAFKEKKHLKRHSSRKH